MDLTDSRWVGAGGPAYYVQGADKEVLAILYWTEADVATDDEDDISVKEAGWSVVFTDNGDCVDVPGAVSLTGLSDEEQVEAIERTIKAAGRLLEAD
jgi:hypothetical protein